MGKSRHPHLVYWSTLKIANDLYHMLVPWHIFCHMIYAFFVYKFACFFLKPVYVSLWPSGHWWRAFAQSVRPRISISVVCQYLHYWMSFLFVHCMLSCDVASVTTKCKHFVKIFLFLLCVHHGSRNLWSGKCCSVFCVVWRNTNVPWTWQNVGHLWQV